MNAASRGNITSQVGVIIGLIAVAAIAGVSLLGHNPQNQTAILPQSSPTASVAHLPNATSEKTDRAVSSANFTNNLITPIDPYAAATATDDESVGTCSVKPTKDPANDCSGH